MPSPATSATTAGGDPEATSDANCRAPAAAATSYAAGVRGATTAAKAAALGRSMDSRSTAKQHTGVERGRLRHHGGSCPKASRLCFPPRTSGALRTRYTHRRTRLVRPRRESVKSKDATTLQMIIATTSATTTTSDHSQAVAAAAAAAAAAHPPTQPPWQHEHEHVSPDAPSTTKRARERATLDGASTY